MSSRKVEACLIPAKDERIEALGAGKTTCKRATALPASSGGLDASGPFGPVPSASSA